MNFQKTNTRFKNESEPKMSRLHGETKEFGYLTQRVKTEETIGILNKRAIFWNQIEIGNFKFQEFSESTFSQFKISQ